MGPNADVVDERRGQTSFEIGLREWHVKVVEARGLLQRPPESFQAVLSKWELSCRQRGLLRGAWAG
jgi:hypothetical protein